MTTKLEVPLRREIEIDGAPYTLAITPQGMTLVLKGRRKGFELEWAALVSGDAAIATALNASLTAKLTTSPKAERSATRPTTSKQARGKAKIRRQ